jgi:hypothetical protein
MCVCTFRHNYLCVNGIVSFPSFTWLYKEEYKQRGMWHFAQRAEISEEIFIFQPGRCQATGIWLISTETKNEELLIAMQRFRNHAYIDGNNWSRRLWKESYRQLQESSRYTRATPGNQLVIDNCVTLSGCFLNPGLSVALLRTVCHSCT